MDNFNCVLLLPVPIQVIELCDATLLHNALELARLRRLISLEPMLRENIYGKARGNFG